MRRALFTVCPIEIKTILRRCSYVPLTFTARGRWPTLGNARALERLFVALSKLRRSRHRLNSGQAPTRDCIHPTLDGTSHRLSVA